MTKVYYTVEVAGTNKRYNDYKTAKVMSECLNKPIVTHYEPIYEQTAITPEYREARVAAIRKGGRV